MSIRDDALAIWNAGITAVDSSMAVQRHVEIQNNGLLLADVRIPLSPSGRIEVVGAGKAGAGMAAGLESALLATKLTSHLTGWVNVPADCVQPLQRIHLHAARPAGLNEPTPEAVRGTEEILRRIRSLKKTDVCIVLLSGGASALLCCPTPGISLDDKLLVTRALASRGAPIHDLNLVRTQLSQVKGGQLAAACQADTLIALIISDVIGDPLDVIGSGPTTRVVSDASRALQVLRQYDLLHQIPKSVVSFLQRAVENPASTARMPPCLVNRIVASNSIAVTAAAKKAESLGYRVESLGSANAGEAADEGRALADRLFAIRSQMESLKPAGNQASPICILSGGEPTVKMTSFSDNQQLHQTFDLAPRGGRNQELVLAAVTKHQNPNDWHHVALLSGGTDGEDGPTDAAGAVADEALMIRLASTGLNPHSYLSKHDSYSFFDAVGGLVRTGPTHTNVMDLRVGLVDSLPIRES